jgi:hypothetical protein
MKKIISFACVALLFCAAFTLPTTEKGNAVVNQYEGLYIFTDCKPVSEFEYLGTVKYSGSFGSGQYVEVRDALIKKAKKDFPGCNAIILTLIEGSADKADAVKLK